MRKTSKPATSSASKKAAALFHGAARVYARAADRTPADLERKRSQYQARALELIRQALATLPPGQRASFLWGQVRTDRTFRYLTAHQGFRDLEKEYPRPAP